MVPLALLLGCSAGAPMPIDRQAVVQRHIVRLGGVGGLNSVVAAAAAAVAATDPPPPCSVEGHWFDAHDTARRDEFTVTVAAAAAALCPSAGRVHSFNASTQRAWKEVPVCSYANGTLWIGRTGVHAAYQTGAIGKACESLTWADPSPSAQQFHWCRAPGTPSCPPHRPSPSPPGPPATHPVTPQTLTVGNGVIGFNADLTGFQSLNETYKVFPLTTLSDWGWHSSPFPAGGPSPFEDFEYTEFKISSGRSVPYPLNQSWAGGQWLRENPHRLDLIQVALRRQSAVATPLVPADLNMGKGASQALDPWTGELTSNFTFNGHTAISTRTAAMMDLDVLSWALKQQPITPGELRVLPPDPLVMRVAFPYGSGASNGPGHDWHSDSKHTTTVVRQSSDSVLLKRTLNFDAYEVLCRWSDEKYRWTRDGLHSFHLKPPNSSSSSTSLELSCLLVPPDARYAIDPDASWLQTKSASARALLSSAALLPLYDGVAAAAAAGWEAFWQSGAFVDLGTSEPRAVELERRVVLSQYLTRSQSAGSMPPQETGYTLNSWYGKFHHEMRWWHQTHFALWQRPELLQRSDGWFVQMLPNVRVCNHS
jgi:hypothetical protein